MGRRRWVICHWFDSNPGRHMPRSLSGIAIPASSLAHPFFSASCKMTAESRRLRFAPWLRTDHVFIVPAVLCQRGGDGETPTNRYEYNKTCSATKVGQAAVMRSWGLPPWQPTLHSSSCLLKCGPLVVGYQTPEEKTVLWNRSP